MPESPPATIVHGDYRLGNTMVRRERAGAAGRDLRLGDGHDRRPARRRRLHDCTLGRGGRPAAHDVRAAPRHAPRGLPDPRRADRRATRSARAARCATCAGTRRSRSGRPRCSWRATTSARSRASTDDPYLKPFGEGVAELAERALEITGWLAAGRYRGLLVDFGGVLTDQRLRRRSARSATPRGSSPRRVGRLVPRGPRGARAAATLETASCDEDEFEPRFGAMLGVRGPTAWSSGCSAGVGPDERCSSAVRAARRPACGPA